MYHSSVHAECQVGRSIIPTNSRICALHLHNDPDDAKWVSETLVFNPTLMQMITTEY